MKVEINKPKTTLSLKRSKGDLLAYYETDRATIYCGDCLEVMRSMPDNSVDAIVTDPPYFRVKNEAWDRQWDTAQGFLDWLDKIAEQWYRLLKPNGSLYCFASPKMAARVEVLIGERFNVLNHIVWRKEQARHKLSCKEVLRGYFDQTERIIFAEHCGADNIAKGEAGYGAKCDELRGFVFEPIRSYLCREFERAGMLNTDGKIAANVACGFSASNGGMASRHYFSQSQWCLPTEEHYAALRALLNGNGGEYLRREYEDLRREYEDLRRPFSVTADVPYTDVWDFPTVQYYNGKHPCEKPLEMIKHILTASTRENAVVLDCFMGSGVVGKACKDLNRRFIGIELSEEYCAISKARIEAEAMKMKLNL